MPDVVVLADDNDERLRQRLMGAAHRGGFCVVLAEDVPGARIIRLDENDELAAEWIDLRGRANRLDADTAAAVTLLIASARPATAAAASPRQPTSPSAASGNLRPLDGLGLGDDLSQPWVGRCLPVPQPM